MAAPTTFFFKVSHLLSQLGNPASFGILKRNCTKGSGALIAFGALSSAAHFLSSDSSRKNDLPGSTHDQGKIDALKEGEALSDNESKKRESEETFHSGVVAVMKATNTPRAIALEHLSKFVSDGTEYELVNLNLRESFFTAGILTLKRGGEVGFTTEGLKEAFKGVWKREEERKRRKEEETWAKQRREEEKEWEREFKSKQRRMKEKMQWERKREEKEKKLFENI